MSTAADFPKATFARLCAIERKLHAWAEAECNGEIQWEDQECTIPRRFYPDRWGAHTVKGPVIPNQEAKLLAEAEKLAAQCGARIYYQGDPRGCSLYIYRDSDLEGRSFPMDQIYSSAAVALC